MNNIIPAQHEVSSFNLRTGGPAFRALAKAGAFRPRIKAEPVPIAT